ncbi:MAG TPA: ABC transporter permease [Vicinamibacteria bacterium]|nr:ABC transporter permease [Vicinamibacteria bacterium]
MRDWALYVREQLSHVDWDEATRSRVVQELSEMMEAYEGAALEDGASPEQARFAAEGQVPDWEALISQIQESAVNVPGRRSPFAWRSIHSGRRFTLLSGIGKDLRSAVRSLAKYPAFAAIVILTLALGIGANAAIFSLVDAVLLTPLPFEDPDELVRVFSTHPENSYQPAGVSTGDVVDWRRRNDVFEGIGAWYVMGRTLSTEQTVEVVNVAQVSEDFFTVLRTSPMLGRTFTPEETARATFNSAAAHTGTDPVMVISHRAWQQRFGADASILDQSLVLDRQSWRVIGVMPPDFDFPSPDVELWIPWSFEGKRPHDQRYLGAIARLKTRVTLDAAEAGMNAIAAALGKELPESNDGWQVALVPLYEDIVSDSRATLAIVLGAVITVLLVACVNIASLQLVRIGERQREIVLRLALGASRARLARQYLAESLLLAILGGALAIPSAIGVLSAMGALLPEGIPRWNDIGLSASLLSCAAVLTACVGVFFGLVPLAASPGQALSATINEASGRTAGGAARWERLRKLLVVSELGMAVVLLAATGLLVRSFVHLIAVDVGFRPDQVIVLPITLDNHEYDSGGKTRAYYKSLTEKLAGVPGVVSVGGVTALPMSPIGPDFDRPIWAEGEIPPPGGSRRADIRMATPGYFPTLGISVLRGRAFDDTDTPDSSKVVMVNEILARQIWPGEDPIGKRLVIDYSTAGTYPYEVVGMVNDVRFYGLRSMPRAELYLPHAQRSYLIMNIAVRTEVEPEALVPDLRRAVLEVDPMQPAYGVMPLRELVRSSVARDRFAMVLIGSFGVLALALALLGIFGVLSYHVGQRTHEVGVRAALGASRRDIVAMMLSAGLRLSLAGIGLGVLLSLLSMHWLTSMLFGVSPVDPLTFGIVTVLPAAGALVACYLPARRAAAVDPVIALRHE